MWVYSLLQHIPAVSEGGASLHIARTNSVLASQKVIEFLEGSIPVVGSRSVLLIIVVFTDIFLDFFMDVIDVVFIR